MRTCFPITVLIALGLTILPIEGQRPRNRNRPDSFSYYMLVLSYAPDFCSETGSRDPEECGTGTHAGFVVHGLWPQGETTRGPENCGSAGPVPPDIVQSMRRYFPSESLIRHEWSAHGSCSGWSAAEYFAAVKKARDSVTVPASLTPPTRQSLPAADVEGKVASANPAFPQGAFRVSCYPDGELKEIRICLTKDLSPRACGSSAGRCAARAVTLLPVH